LSTRLFLKASTTHPRHEMVTRVERAIAESGGWVLDHHLFSNLAISLSFEIPAERGAALLDRLEATELNLAPESVSELRSYGQECEAGGAGCDGDVTGYLHITFIHDEPDLRRDVPAIPG
jgi:hypothetical protein